MMAKKVKKYGSDYHCHTGNIDYVLSPVLDAEYIIKRGKRSHHHHSHILAGGASCG